MDRTRTLMVGASLLASSIALTLAPAAVATSTVPKVTVRIEGKTKTLLAATAVQVKGRKVRKGGHACVADSGAGALNVATHGRWSGSWDTSLADFDITKILGDSENYDVTKSYWEIFVNNVPASTGICGIKLHAGEQILFAAVGASESPADPLGLEIPSTATTEHGFIATVVSYNAKGKAVPLAGATVTVLHRTTKTGAGGKTVPLVPATAGTFTFTASKAGYIRAEATVTVTAS